MSWQDELQQLDSALASGQISADEYRMRRDRVIAQASGQHPGEPEQSAEATTVFRPVPPQPGDCGDRTQIVSNHGGGDADSTQVVPNAGQNAGPPPHFPPPQPPPPWESAHPQQPNVSPPPWANEDLPPEFGQQSWPRQGPEVFEEKGGGGAGKVIAIVVAIVLALGGAGAAIYFFAIKDKGGDKQTQQTTDNKKPTSTPPPPPNIPDGPFVELPGDTEKLNKTMTIAEAVAAGQPTKNEAALLQSLGVAEVGALVVDDKDGMRQGIWAFKVGEGGDAKAVLTAMDDLYDKAQFELVSQENGVLVRKRPQPSPDKPTVIRAHFVTKDGYMVRVEVLGTDTANVDSTFADLIEEVTGEYPPEQ